MNQNGFNWHLPGGHGWRLQDSTSFWEQLPPYFAGILMFLVLIAPAPSPRPGSPVTLYSAYSLYSHTAIHAIHHTALYSLPLDEARSCTHWTPLTSGTTGSIVADGNCARRCAPFTPPIEKTAVSKDYVLPP